MKVLFWEYLYIYRICSLIYGQVYFMTHDVEFLSYTGFRFVSHQFEAYISFLYNIVKQQSW